MVFLLLCFAVPGLSRAADPFYTNLLRDGIAASERGDFQEAQDLLRLANFGFLDEPNLLAEGLARLSLTHARAGDPDEFRSTFRKLMEIENQFEAYSKNSFPPSLQSSFVETVRNLVPEAELSTFPAFADLAKEKAVERIAALPKSQRREALSERAQIEPEEPKWRLQLAKLTLEEGLRQEALPLLDQLISEGKESEQAHCLRGQTLAEMQRCTEAITDLTICPETRLQARFASPLVSCLTEMESWEQANATLLALEPSVRSQREFTRLGRRIEKGLKRQEAQRQEELEASGEDLADLASEPVARDENHLPSFDPPAASMDQKSPAASQVATQRVPDDPRLEGEDVARRAAEEKGGGRRPTSASQNTELTPPAPRTSPAPKNLSSEDEARLVEARSLLSNAKKVADLEPALTLAQSVADAFPQSRRAQHLVAEIAYRGSLWEKSATYFRRGGDPGDNRPNLLFFMAISFYESGDPVAAEGALERALPKLQRTSFVEDYIEKILSESGS